MKNVDKTHSQTEKKQISTERIAFEKTITMEELLLRFPHLVSNITHNKLLCAGCFLARFHDIADAAHEHGLDEDKLYGELIAATQGNDENIA